MASKPETVAFILDQLTQSDAQVTARKMFAEYGLFADGKMVAMVCDDQLFVKPTDGGRAFAAPIDEASPYPGAKPCLLVDGERWDDTAWLAELFAVTTRELPVPKPRRKRS